MPIDESTTKLIYFVVLRENLSFLLVEYAFWYYIFTNFLITLVMKMELLITPEYQM